MLLLLASFILLLIGLGLIAGIHLAISREPDGTYYVLLCRRLGIVVRWSK